MPATPIVTNLDAFQEETDRLIRDAQALHNEEARYRKELAVLNEEFHVWMEHVTIVQTALAELDESFKTSLDMEPNVECPMCGQHYSNHIVDQFEIIADKDELLQSLQLGRQKTGEIETRIATHRRAINGVVIAHALFARRGACLRDEAARGVIGRGIFVAPRLKK